MASDRRERQRANRARGTEGATMTEMVAAAAPVYAPQPSRLKRVWRWLTCPTCWGLKARWSGEVLRRFG